MAARHENGPQFDDVRPSRSNVRSMKARARGSDDALQEAYESGRSEAAAQLKWKADQKKLGIQTRKRKYKTAKRVARKVARPVSAGTSRGFRQAQAPVTAQIASATKLAVMTGCVVGLYLFLENATFVNGALGSIARSVEWLKAPDKSIPYAKKG